MIKENIIKFLLEDAFGLYDENKNILINEVVSSVEDPEFNKMEKYYTRYSSSKDLFNKLSDAQKVFVLNTVDSVVNGGKKRMEHPSNSDPTIAQQVILTMLATESVKGGESIDGWKPENIDSQNIKEFIMTFYNPYKAGEKLSYVGYKAIPESVLDKFKFSPDIVLDAYITAIKELLDEKKYDPEKSTFDFTLMQLTWPTRILNIIGKKQRRKDINIDPIVKTGEGDDEEEIDLTLAHGAKDADYSYMTDKAKWEIILNQFKDTDRAALQGFFNFIFSETNDKELAAEKAIDIIYDNDGDLENVSVEEIPSGGKESMYDYIAKELGREFNEQTEGYLKSLISKLRPKLLDLFRNPRFKEIMGIEDWSEKDLDILKGTGTKGRKWKKASDVYKDVESSILEPKSGEAFDEFGNILQRDEEGKIIRKSKKDITEIMFECVNNIYYNFNYRFNKFNNTLDKLNKINSFINEGFDVAVKDLDQDIYNYINNTVDGLDKANYMLNELEIVSNDIKYDYPEVSEKLHESIEPLIEELENLIRKVKSVKTNLKPFLSESASKKKDDDELDEERITNPESKEYVKRRENFIGSHIYGEDLGGLGKMYVAYSYGEQFPVYLWYKNKWYHNASNYVLDDGTVNEPTLQHKMDMRPVQDTHGLSTLAMNTLIRKFKKKYGLGDNVHTDVEPGEKN